MTTKNGKSTPQLNKNGKPQGMHPNSRVNLDKGRVTNHRTAKDYSITRIIKEILDQPAVERWLEVEDKDKNLTWRQAIAKRILVEAVKGNAKVTGELLDRLEGKVTQPIQAEVEGEIKQSFYFILPDGKKVKASEFVKENGNSD